MTNPYFPKIKGFLLELGFDIRRAEEQDGILVVDRPEMGIKSLVIGCADPLLILEQYLLELPAPDCDIYRQLLQKNRDMIHGAFVLDESGRKVIFRDTIQIETLDRPELEAALNSLGLLLSEYSEELIRFSK